MGQNYDFFIKFQILFLKIKKAILLEIIENSMTIEYVCKLKFLRYSCDEYADLSIMS
jgi:hypothetical protein